MLVISDNVNRKHDNVNIIQAFPNNNVHHPCHVKGYKGVKSIFFRVFYPGKRQEPSAQKKHQVNWLETISTFLASLPNLKQMLQNNKHMTERK
jgi:hypothetical protein